MIKQLKRRLVLIFTFFTGLVLALVLAFSLWSALQQNTDTHIIGFEADNELIWMGVAAGKATPEWLGAIEQEKDVVIFLDRNGQPVVSMLDAQENRADLLQAAEERLQDSDHSFTAVTVTGENETERAGKAEAMVTNGSTRDLLATATETVQDAEGKKYWILATTALVAEDEIPGAEPDIYHIVALKATSAMNRQATWIVLAYVGLLVLGILILALVNRFLAGFVLKPIVESIQQQTEFVAAASHELRNPLAVVRNSAHAGRKAKTAEDAAPYFDMVDAEAARMGRLVDDLLVLAGSESGRWHIQESIVDLDPLLIEASDLLADLGRQKSISLVLALPEEPLGKMRGDADRMMQVLRVLVDNAMWYSPEGGTVELRTKKGKNGVNIQVVDHGPGVPEEDKPRVFDRFYRSDKSRSSKEHFGLGLSVAKELLEMHGGTLGLEDTPGGGATFTVRLPARLFV